MQAQLLAWTLRRRQWRNLLIMLSVAMTVAVMIGFFSTRIELSKFFSRLDDVPYQRFWIKPRNLSSYQTYPLSLKNQLEKIPGVERLLYVVRVRGETPDGDFISGEGAADGILEVERDFFPTDDATIERWKTQRDGAVFGERVAAELHLEVGKPGEFSTPKGPLKFTVSGISRGGPLPDRVVLHYEYADEFLGRKGLVGDYRVVLDKKTDSAPVVKAVDEVLKTHGIAAHMVSERTMMALRGAGTAGLIPSLLGALGFVLLVTTSLAITNTTMISVRERRAELATLRVLGFKKLSVAFMIVSEMFVVCAAGGLVGAAIAWLAMRHGLELGTSLLPSVTMTRIGLAVGLATSVGVPLVGSIASSWLAVRAPLAQALRDAG